MQTDYDIKTVKFWSDGCASQFRNQFAFFILSKFDHAINTEWNYFEANHGKGAVDGIGGTVKHAVYSNVFKNRVVIKSPKQFAGYANEILPKKLLFSVWRMNPWSSDINQNAEKKQKKLKEHWKFTALSKFMQNLSYQLKFFMTSKSHDPVAEVQYQVAVLPQHVLYKIGTYVLVWYESELWPGQITKVEQDRVRVKCFQKAAAQGSIWRWPDKSDDGLYQTGDAEWEIETPLDIGSSSSSFRPSNLLVRVAKVDCLHK